MFDFKTKSKGLILSSGIGLTGYFFAPLLPSALNSILVALLLGMLIGNLFRIPVSFQTGIGFTASRMLEWSILFLAFSINYQHIAALGISSFAIIALMVVLMLITTYYLAIKIKCPGSTGWLIGFGTSICGSSAIAALTPTITKNKEDVAISMAVVNLFGSLGMILLPILLTKFEVNTRQMGLIIGGTLHSVGNVVGAAYSVNNAVGEAAVTIKLARVALLSPALIFFNYLVNRHQVLHWKDHFKLPWYLWSFIGITLITSVVQIPIPFTEVMDTAGKLVLTIAMAAIGLNIRFGNLLQSGKKGVLFGLLIFAIQILVLILLMLAL